MASYFKILPAAQILVNIKFDFWRVWRVLFYSSTYAKRKVTRKFTQNSWSCQKYSSQNNNN